MRPLLFGTLALTLLGGCLSSRPVGHFGESAYYHQRDHYRIRYSEGTQELMPAGWRLGNYQRDEAGRPTFANHEEHQAVFTGAFVGRGRGRTFNIPAVDLRYDAPGGDGEIWVRTVPLPVGWNQAGTSEVLHGALAALSRPTYGAPELRPRWAHVQRTETRAYGDAQVDGMPAHWAEADVYNSRGVAERMTLVAMRVSPDHPYQHGRRVRVPILLVMGHRSSPEVHEDQRADFASLVRRVDIQR